MTATSYKVLGISMERQSARRRFVVIVYAVLLLFCAGSIVFARTAPLLYGWTIYAALGAGIFLFGGVGGFGGSRGLIKPFPNIPPRPEPVMVDVIRLQLAPMTAGTPDESSWKNDERELGRRDRTHYQAFQVTGLALIAILPLATFGMRTAEGLRHPEWLTVTLVLSLIYAISLAGSVLVLTLPAAIILWTEPDMDLG